ncbi:hypothetical protein [Polyangium sp. y55x31]|uniref:hypothetical protein n=1 Tax=Polyangium sp. y55x31 TaxID=3042688 RepID=UPI002482E6EF|nr:hypothetical protein [Polyangium sp. y55x31]MDI1476087.1 hypothetical protein [Polyangium sp. y55x31]
MFDPARLLALNAGAQIVFSSLLGWSMVVARQPWMHERARVLRHKAMTAAHLDWLMLAFMQAVAAFLLDRWPVSNGGTTVAVLLVYGGWVNPTAYVFRALGVDAFAFAGGLGQRAASAFAGTSSVAILAGWIVLLVAQFTRP